MTTGNMLTSDRDRDGAERKEECDGRVATEDVWQATVELSIFGVRTLSYLIGQPRYGLVFCDEVLHTFFCRLSLDSIS